MFAARRLARIAGRCSALRSFSSAEESSDLASKIIKFADDAGQVSFGVFASQDEKLAFRVGLGDDGKMAVESEPVKIGVFLPPVDAVSVFGIGLNYKKHAAETKSELPKNPVLFMKSISSLTGHRSPIIIPRIAQEKPEVDYEGELAVVIGRPARNVPKEEALHYVLGYSIANDVTARRWQKNAGGGQWNFGKSFDTFCPLGPFMIPAGHVDPTNLQIVTTLNDEVVQDGNTSDMIFPVADIISYLSQGMTLLPGTVILTGTPEGVGYARNPPKYLKRGDVVSVSITGLGTLTNHVEEETDWGSTRA